VVGDESYRALFVEGHESPARRTADDAELTH
jgi:hypothetical protein